MADATTCCPDPLPPQPVVQDRDDESLFSEADSEENTDSELNLKHEYNHNWDDGVGDDGSAGRNNDDLEKVLQEKLILDNPISDTDDDDENGDQLREIFYMLVPCEITELIFDRLDLNSKRAARLVCKRWLDLVDPLLQWYPVLTDEFGPSVLQFIQKPYTVNTLTTGKLSEFEYPLKGLGIGVQTIDFSFQCVPIIPIVDTQIGVSNKNLNNILHEYRNIENGFILNSRAFMQIDLPSPFRMTKFANLVSLEISACMHDGKGYYVCLETLDNFFPSLTTLKLTLLYHRETIFLQHPPSYKETFQFIANHYKTLNTFEILYSNMMDERTIPPFVFDLDHSIPPRVYQQIMSGLQKVQLSELTFRPTFYDGRARFLFGIQLMNHQQCLTCLKIGNLSRPNFAVWESAIEVMRRCFKTLCEIQCEGCICPENRPLDQFSCGIFQSHRNLKHVKLTLCGLKITDVELLPPTIKILHLGSGLSSNQIKLIASNMTELRELYLPQDRAQFDRTIPKTSVGIFKSIVKLPMLDKLLLTKRCSSWKRIRKIISYTQGLDVADRASYDIKDSHLVKIIIDRNRLELDRL